MGFSEPAAGPRPGGDREALRPRRGERRGRTQGVRNLPKELLRRYFSGEVANRHGCGLGLHRLPRPRDPASERGGVEAQNKREREEVPSLLQESPRQRSDGEHPQSRDLHLQNRLKGTTRREDRKAFEILAAVKGSPVLAGKRPISIAAAALYLASLDTEGGATQLRIAAAAEVTPITIRKRSLEISTALKESPKASTH